MNVLSLFDGISCGMIALSRNNINVNKYYASEIDKYAIKISLKNYPNIIHIGDVSLININELDNIDLLIGGSPCQGLSNAGKKLGFEDKRSNLFFEYVRILNEIKIKNNNLLFLLENVKMKKQYENIINNELGCEPIQINSNLVSAQNRKRLYWTNIKIQKINDLHIQLSDILENNVDNKYFLSEKQKSLMKCFGGKSNFAGKINTIKSSAILASYGKASGNSGKILTNNMVRCYTPLECERLQTLPDNYTSGISDYQRYKLIGNCWTVDIIKNILKGVNN